MVSWTRPWEPRNSIWGADGVARFPNCRSAWDDAPRKQALVSSSNVATLPPALVSSVAEELRAESAIAKETRKSKEERLFTRETKGKGDGKKKDPKDPNNPD